ncbi:hypothetical protein [Halalkalibacter alkalisediminis]|uniref:Uncharacterized protein n=1 Tax=Halalkalibacter alkalisediminis TaxID=935616 RepID=A0ABV6NHG2_9BACI|nr:hypothetical protein [Halalkalibacter alkalisediminis]
MTLLRYLFTCIGFIVFLSGCVETKLTAEEVITQSIEAMDDISEYAFSIESYIENENTLTV